MTNENVKLRAVEPQDIDCIFKWENDHTLWHLSNTLIPFSRFDLEQYVMNADKDIYQVKQLRLIIDYSHEDQSKAIGCIDLFDFDPTHKRAGIGILIDANEQNKGFASIALELIIDYAFNTLNLHQLYCNIEEDNKKSLTLFKKKHFQEIGVKKDWNLRDGKWINEYLLQLIKP